MNKDLKTVLIVAVAGLVVRYAVVKYPQTKQLFGA